MWPRGNCKPNFENFHFETGFFEMGYFVKPRVRFPEPHKLDQTTHESLIDVASLINVALGILFRIDKRSL